MLAATVIIKAITHYKFFYYTSQMSVKNVQFHDMKYKMLTKSLNSPHNPTGKVFTKGELEIIAGECCSRNCLAITDEVCTPLLCTISGFKHDIVA